MLQVAPDQSAIELSAELLHELAESIWSSLLDLDVQRGADPATSPLASEPSLTCRVTLEGDWRGFIILVCPKAIVRKAAAAMFKTSPCSITETELRDTIGELTHMLGGNLKSLLPAPSRLSPPLVMDSDPVMIEGRAVGQAYLSCEGQPLQITLFKQEQ